MHDTTVADGRSPLRDFWANTAAVNSLLLIVAVGLSFWMIRSAFTQQFRCNYLIVDQVSAPEFMCTGADLGRVSGVTSAVDSVSDFLGLGDDDSGSTVGDSMVIPGLAGLIDGPLDVIRRIGVIAGLLLLAGFSAFATWMVRHLQFILRLLSGDRRAWQLLASITRTFLTIFVALLAPISLLVLT
jgi:hypothetical protein